MIKIEEISPTLKISGTSSLLISFPYNQAVIDIIKQSGNYSYSKKTYQWEVPVTSLSFLLDNLTYVDDIELTLLEEKELEKPKRVVNYKIPLFPHQIEGVEWGLVHPSWLMLFSPGLGKTLTTTALAEELKAQKGIEHCLVICGVATLRANWEKEIKKFSNLDCTVIGKKITKTGRVTWASLQDRASQLRNKINEFFVILNIESLRSPLIVEAIQNSINRFDMIVVDEIHKCVSGESLIDTDLGKLKIKDIVDKKIKCSIKSYNTKTNKIEFKPIINYYNNGKSSNLIQLKIKDEQNKTHTVVCTPEHKIFTLNRGYVEAQFLNDKDNIIIF